MHRKTNPILAVLAALLAAGTLSGCACGPYGFGYCGYYHGGYGGDGDYYRRHRHYDHGDYGDRGDYDEHHHGY